MTSTLRVTYLQTHPVQYMAPLFRFIAEHRTDIELTVLYASMPSAAQQGVGFNEAFEWDLGLLEGYAHRVISTDQKGRRFDSDSLRGADVGPVDDAIAATRPDVVVVPGWHSAYYLRAIAACRRQRIPVLYRGDSNLVKVRRGLLRPLWSLRTRAALRMFDGYLSVGTRSREYLRHFAVPESLIFDSPHAVDGARFDAAASDAARAHARREIAAAADDFVVLFAGKLTAIKRPADLVGAVACLGPKAILAVAGNGPLLSATRAEADRRGLRIVLLGFLNQQAMPGALAAADCVALPSESESWGLIVNEALAVGTPCVVSDRVGCAADLVREGVSGSVHRMGDIDDLARALERVRASRAAGAITRESCRAAVAPFSFARAADGIRKGADRLLKRTQITSIGEPRVLATLGNMVSVFGLERMTFEVLRSIREQGGAVHCIVNEWESSRVVDMADDIGAGWSTGYYRYELRRRARLRERLLAAWDIFRTSLDLLRDARRFRPTHVFAPEFNAILRSMPALWILRRMGVRVVLRLGNAPEPGRFYGFLWRQLIDRCVDQYVPNSKFIQQELLAHGISPSKSRVVYNTVPFRRPSALPFLPTPGRVIYVGQIIPPKGVDVLLEAIALVRARGIPVTLDIVGDVEGWEAPTFSGYRASIRRRASQPDLVDAVRLLGLRDDVPTLLAAASLHCLPSRPEQKEGFTVATLEAKRAGLPSVVTQCGALPEMIRHKVDGWICSDVTPQAVAEGLVYFLEDPHRARAASDEARASERLFNHARFAAEWADVFAGPPSSIAATAHTRPS